MDSPSSFAVDRAVKLYKQLQISEQITPDVVFDFFNDLEFYQSLDPQTFKDAGPSFIFCGLMHEACAILIQKGEHIRPPTYDCLTVSSRAVRIMVHMIGWPATIQSTKTQANLDALIREFKTLETDFKHNQSNIKDEKVWQKAQIQINFLHGTLIALQERATSEPTFSEHCPAQYRASYWEISFALISSLATSVCILYYEKRGVSHSMFEQQTLAFDRGYFGFILDTYPALMLISVMLICYLALAYSVALFIHRHQEQDKFQTYIFLFVIAAASTLGSALRINAYLIMLGILPWGFCFAMIFSSAVHWLVLIRRTYLYKGGLRTCGQSSIV